MRRPSLFGWGADGYGVSHEVWGASGVGIFSLGLARNGRGKLGGVSEWSSEKKIQSPRAA